MTLFVLVKNNIIEKSNKVIDITETESESILSLFKELKQYKSDNSKYKTIIIDDKNVEIYEVSNGYIYGTYKTHIFNYEICEIECGEEV